MAIMYPILPGLPFILDIQKRKFSKYDSQIGEYYTWKWGWRINPVTNQKQWHNGNDLPATQGTDVYAPWDAIVSIVAYDDTSGNYIKLAHDVGLTGGINETAYCHLYQVNVKPNTKVSAGQKIAEVGTTGRSTGPHLHFITRMNKAQFVGGDYRQDIDPLPWLEQASAEAKITGAGGGMSLLTAFLLSLAGFYLFWKYI